MTHPPDIIEVIARELYELMRLSNPGCPAWEHPDPADPHEAGLIQIAREAAREFIPTDGPAPSPQIPS